MSGSGRRFLSPAALGWILTGALLVAAALARRELPVRFALPSWYLRGHGAGTARP
ncbi:MAG: hypothetical protein KIT22_01470 [Verrucomicrobiae bacterium]|nr:hypothetical protein [Verrucomicrobiae bacterium]